MPTLAKDGGAVKTGYDAGVDELRALADGGKQAILAIEDRERARTGISKHGLRCRRPGERHPVETP